MRDFHNCVFLPVCARILTHKWSLSLLDSSKDCFSNSRALYFFLCTNRIHIISSFFIFISFLCLTFPLIVFYNHLFIIIFLTIRTKKAFIFRWRLPGALGFEPRTCGFGDRYSTSWTIPLYKGQGHWPCPILPELGSNQWHHD